VKNPDWQFLSDVDKATAVETRRKLYDMPIAEKMPIQAFHAGSLRKCEWRTTATGIAGFR
jgi:hypothetical protein